MEVKKCILKDNPTPAFAEKLPFKVLSTWTPPITNVELELYHTIMTTVAVIIIILITSCWMKYDICAIITIYMYNIYISIFVYIYIYMYNRYIYIYIYIYINIL